MVLDSELGVNQRAAGVARQGQTFGNTALLLIVSSEGVSGFDMQRSGGH